MRLIFLLPFYLAIAASCGPKKKEKEPPPNPRSAELLAVYQAKLQEAASIRNPTNKWLTPSDCDGIVWAGKYSCGIGPQSDVDIGAAEYPDQPGRYDRRPPPYCWTPETGDQGSKTTWSRDMGIAGLMPHAWCTRDLAMLEEHAKYGEAHKWSMGEPYADGRAVYSPSVVGMLYSLIYSLGGNDNPARGWPGFYPPGLDDYQAHLQVMDIWLRGELYGSSPNPVRELPQEGSLTFLDISSTMYSRLTEHAKRESECAFYAYVKGVYDGTQDRTIELLLAYPQPQCSYVRANDTAKAGLAEWLFVARQTLIKLKEI